MPVISCSHFNLRSDLYTDFKLITSTDKVVVAVVVAVVVVAVLMKREPLKYKLFDPSGNPFSAGR